MSKEEFEPHVIMEFPDYLDYRWKKFWKKNSGFFTAIIIPFQLILALFVIVWKVSELFSIKDDNVKEREGW